MTSSGRRALITGAGSGIGAACVDRLLAQGCRVTAVDLHAGDMAARAGELDAIHEVDVTDAAAVRAIDGIDRMDIVVQSAGVVGPNVPLLDTPLDGWERTFDVNVTGIFNVMQATLGGMVERGWGRVVNIASIAGKEGNPNLSAYSASKGAVIALTKSVAKELATTGVLANSIAPAVIATPMNLETAPEVLEYMLSKIPMGRLGETSEVAALVGWLCSEDCSFSTGACYDISGGRATY
ncbi:MAG: SDR family oxidoreductase [Acidimicrobiaceae bacterium]|nr:SDR family oxidoreductase [Acidimicrobiaceae bacterium]MYA00013.1 SDR family oxidoreductase [Acidimicrobiaceae bacterium]MYE76308.1 SDR family oxidoreductase [Acidimicrobiaceae bacterium]MYE98177.1 SDR family oxidoreductase [Acidimicrobiaceae bacterium]MYI54333.1 SDR family oxidoreductase [Acidimicrobiaceae bacterium]